MAAPPILKRLMHRRVQLTVLSALSFLCLVATAIMTTQVFLTLDEYGSSRADNAHWASAQLEVDQVKLILALEKASSPSPASLEEVRQRFDVLYSRAATLKNGASYREAYAGTSAQIGLFDILATLDSIVPIIDDQNDGLTTQRNAVLQKITDLTLAIRRLSAEGIVADARRAEDARKILTSKLIELTVLSLLMLIALMALLSLMWQLYRLYRRRAFQNRITLNRLSTILNTSQDAVLVVCPKGNIVDVNTAAETMFSLSQPDGSRKTVSQVLYRKSEDGTLSSISGEKLLQSCSDGPNRCCNLTALGPGGAFFPVELSADIAARAGDQVCVCFIRDISRRVAAEEEMQEARDNALAGERSRARFLGVISHEMRTPLHGILGTLDLLDETLLSPEQARYSQVMQSSGQVLLTQINHALDVTQADGGQLLLNEKEFDLDTLLDDLILSQKFEAKSKDIGLELLMEDPPFGRVLGDPDRIKQVLLNLLSNAIKFTSHGQVTIEVARIGKPGTNGDMVEFQISDSGIGISESDLPHIFDDFFRTTSEEGPLAEGTGLGLGIAHEIVILMGGQIGAESLKGEGSLFWVRIPLPCAKKAAQQPSEPGTQAPRLVRPLDILVVEDNATNRFVMFEMLRKDHHKVTQACDGFSAVALAARKSFDLILMDVSMPGVDGIEATRQIRNGIGASCDARIVFLTAHMHPDQDDRLRTAGADAVYTKPLRRSALRFLIADGDTSLRRQNAPARVQVDDTILDQLHAVLAGPKFTFLIESFISEGNAFVKKLEDIRALPPAVLVDYLHRFAGSAATFGAVAIQATLCQAEAAALGGDYDKVEQELRYLPELWNTTLSVIQTRRQAA